MQSTTTSLCSTIIPVYNRWDLTAECLQSLHQYGIEGMKIIVVDNGSDDQTATDLAPLGKKLFQANFSSIRLDKNYGFSHACNTGAAAAKTPLLFFLNNDTLLTEGCVAKLVDAMQNDESIGAAGPVLLYPDDTVQHIGISHSPNGLSHIYRFFPATHPVTTTPRPLQAITAAAIMVRAQAFVRSGGFFTGYHNGFEDVELCCRLRQMGYRLMVIPSSRIYHLEGQSAGRHAKDADNGTILFARCHDMLYYDLNLHAQVDGYTMSLTDTMEPFISMLQSQESAMDLEMKDKTPVDWLHMLTKEPLWQAGYTNLVRFLTTAKKLEEATALAVKQYSLFPHLNNCIQALKLASMAEAHELMDELKQSADSIANQKINPIAQIEKAKEIIAPENPLFDESLSKIYSEWLQNANYGL